MIKKEYHAVVLLSRPEISLCVPAISLETPN